MKTQEIKCQYYQSLILFIDGIVPSHHDGGGVRTLHSGELNNTLIKNVCFAVLDNSTIKWHVVG